MTSALNLRGRIFQHHDASGFLTNQGPDPLTGANTAFDFKGNLVATTRRFVDDYKALPNWTLPAPLLVADVLTGITRYDALNRVTSAIMPDTSVVHPTYNEANLLQALDVNVLGAAAATSFVANIDYNAKAQRVRIDYGNGATTTYSYDPLTFRLAELTTARPSFPANQQTVQDLLYTYDPVGNVSHIQDNADTQNVIYFNNRRVEPSTDFIYDAVYRLIQAVGREQLGLAAGAPLAPAPTSYNDVPRVQLLQPGDGNAMGLYNEAYQYDDAGNFLQCVHRGTNPASPSWTRSYTYNQASQLESGKLNNQLTRTTVSGGVPFNENYSSDLHGNMTAMPQLQLMNWDFKDRLQMTQRQAVNPSDADGTLHQRERTFYVYNSSGDRVRKTTESAAGVKMKERYYLGPVEIYREYTGGAINSLERKTLHVLDDKRRVAIIESKTADPAKPAEIPAQFGNPFSIRQSPRHRMFWNSTTTWPQSFPTKSTIPMAARPIRPGALSRKSA